MEWLTHTLTALLGVSITSVFAFILKGRSLTTQEWQTMVADLRARIVSLEGSLELQHKEHLECVKIQAELKGKIDMMENVAGQYLRPILAKANGGDSHDTPAV